MENSQANEKKSKSLKIAEFAILLCDVLLLSSALNCLFQMLAYSFSKTFDIVLFALSLGLGLFVHLYALNAQKNPILKNRLTAAICSVVVWAIIIPLLSTMCN